MAPVEGERAQGHQHSLSFDQGRALVPMWDSSDPERAPPPLPLNPQSPGVASRAGTSAAIQSAHAALTEKARESSYVSSAIAKRINDVSPERQQYPERQLIKGATHRRMQSLQTGTVRDLSLMIEHGQNSSSPTPRSPDKLSTRPSTPRNRDPFADSKPDYQDEKALISSPIPGPSLTPILRPTAIRRPPQSILGENTPPQSATMLALQNMATPSRESSREPAKDADAPLANVTNGSTAVVKAPQLDNLSTQILSLTSIAAALQKEMSQLSRRSRDNATDLLSLKEATNARDEDIRKSLRELISNAQETGTRSLARDTYSGSLLLDNKPSSVSPLSSKSARPFALPRIPSPNSFAASLDRDNLSTPSTCHPDTPATIALLEKVVREMGTKEGQELLVKRLSEIADRMYGMASMEKLEELIRLVKSNANQAIVPAAGDGGGSNNVIRPRKVSFDDERGYELEYERPGSMTQRVEKLLQDRDSRRSSAPPTRTADVLNEDVIKVIRSIKDSVAQSGGLTAEVKALVRELRGEVLGMGREIGRRLEESHSKLSNQTDSDINADMAHVIESGLEEMKEHMNALLKDHRRQSSNSVASRATSIDYQEIYNAMRTALKDSEHPQDSLSDLSRDDVIQAVKEAWENYKPEIEVQQLGLEREEVLACLKEGLQEYAPREQHVGATREEVFKAVIEGLKHFAPPQVDTPASLSRDEILEAVRECLEEFEFPVAPSAINADITKEDMIDAVKQGLHAADLHSSSALVPRDMQNDEIVSRLNEIMEFMTAEFRAVSEEAKQNVAANGRDTEQVLDATKDGLEKLRLEIETYVDRVADLSGHSGQEAFMDSLVKSLDGFRDDIAGLIAQASDESKDALKAEVEGLREIVNSSMIPATAPIAHGVANHHEILETLQEGLHSLRVEIGNRPVAGTTEVLDALQEGLSDLRVSIEKLDNKPADLTANDEILDALKAGLDGVRSDIEILRDTSNNDKAVAVIPDNAVVPADMLKHEDIKNLEVLITQLQIKVEALESMPSAAQSETSPSHPDAVVKEDLAALEEALHKVHESVAGVSESVAGISTREPAATDAAAKEDVQAIETILRNTKARLDDLIDGDQAVRKEHLVSLEALILETKHSLGDISSQMESISRKEDVNLVESVIAQVVTGFEELKERHEKQLEDSERVTKTDVDAIEAVCLDVKSVVEQMVKADLAALPTKEDLQNLETLVKEFKDRSDTQIETQAKLIEDRQADTNTVNESVSDVKVFLEDFRTLVQEKLEHGAEGIDSLNKVLGTLSDNAAQNADVGTDLKLLFDTMKTEFEECRAGVVGAKLESDEKFQETTETLSAKIDESIGELMAKYDELQKAMDERTQTGEARDSVLEDAVVGSKAISEELKLLIDTLGSTVTDSLEKMEEASKTVFDRVEDLTTKAEENHSDDKNEHQTTREQVKAAITAVEGLQGHVCEYQPLILETVKEVLLMVGQHFEHSKSSTDTIQEKILEAKPPEQPLLPPPEKYDDSIVNEKLDRLVEYTTGAVAISEKLDRIVDHTQTAGSMNEKLDHLVEHTKTAETFNEKLDQLVEHTKTADIFNEKLDQIVDHTQTAGLMNEKLDQLVEHTKTAETFNEKLDKLVGYTQNADEVNGKLDLLVDHAHSTGGVNEKLNKLVDHTEEAGQAFAKLDTLDQVHQQVIKTAAELSAFLASQTQRIADDHEDREKTLQETTLALERRREETEQVESNMVSLREEEERLKQNIQGLRSEQESLSRQKVRLSADLSSLETALHIRREELHTMEERAEGLERRILDGVMDHSRMLLMSKSTSKARDVMSRKRAPSQRNNGSVPIKISPATNAPESKPLAAVNMALSANRALRPTTPNNAARRILSLSQINNNVPSGGVTRSHSVKTPGGSGPLRKRSWGGRGLTKGFGDSDNDKENGPLKESDEEHDTEGPEFATPKQDELSLAEPPSSFEGDEHGDGHLHDDEDDGDDNDNAGDEDALSDHGTLRRSSVSRSSLGRSSLGTTVITSTETETETEGDQYYSDPDDDDLGSQWTESAVGSHSSFDGEEEAGPHEVVLYDG